MTKTNSRKPDQTDKFPEDPARAGLLYAGLALWIAIGSVCALFRMPSSPAICAGMVLAGWVLLTATQAFRLRLLPSSVARIRQQMADCASHRRQLSAEAVEYAATRAPATTSEKLGEAAGGVGEAVLMLGAAALMVGALVTHREALKAGGEMAEGFAEHLGERESRLKAEARHLASLRERAAQFGTAVAVREAYLERLERWRIRGHRRELVIWCVLTAGLQVIAYGILTGRV
ncbi:hypothetical protein WQE_15326 [Paraburkholderia hospita]|uniref:Integral membrane protein n=1 Tax=Paraburkholderia hospita TaxID=169430 RepID=A0ABN0FNW6_9BURK|nr:hypothetical protein [Paraburkholderia hospita]EIN00414.1 hypothetical protein WQE_15326 [Paraburkholderia hospita]OUL88425.1 hypothetical protein CA602_11225 [Paraburkholderia hospita]